MMERSDEARRLDSLYDHIGKLERLNRQLEAENKRLKELCRWIPVSERLPKIDKKCMQSGWCLITDGKRWVEAYYYDYTEREAKPNCATGKGWYCSGMSRKDITHWKPIILPGQALEGRKG